MNQVCTAVVAARHDLSVTLPTSRTNIGNQTGDGGRDGDVAGCYDGTRFAQNITPHVLRASSLIIPESSVELVGTVLVYAGVDATSAHGS